MMRAAILAAFLLLLALPARAQEGLTPGAALPDFTETTVGGKPCASAAFRGRPLAVWFTNFSDGSYEALPTLVAACARHAGLQLVIVSLNGAYESKPKQFADQFSLHEQTAVDADGSTVRAFNGAFMEGVVPLYNLYLFDGSGRLTARFHYPGIAPAELERELLRL